MMDQAQNAMARSTIGRELNDEEWAVFVAFCESKNLDPVAGHVIPQVRVWNGNRKVTHITTIDAFRLCASRSGEYEGQVGPHWCAEDGVWRDSWLLKDAPSAARVGVLRKNFREPLFAVARYESYRQNSKDGKPTKTWGGMPEVMLAKCAEALALRRAFPAELGGLYERSEMDQADNPSDDAPKASRSKKAERSLSDLGGSVETPPSTGDAVAGALATTPPDGTGLVTELDACKTESDLGAWLVKFTPYINSRSREEKKDIRAMFDAAKARVAGSAPPPEASA